MNARRSLSFFSSIENLPRIESRASDLNRCASGGQLKKKRDGELALWTVTRAHTYTYELGNEALVLGVSRVTPEQKRGTEVQDYGFRLYNKAAGRFLSTDPLTSSYPMLTPYQFASNTPIQAIDLDELEAAFVQATGRIGLFVATGSMSTGIAMVWEEDSSYDEPVFAVYHSVGGGLGLGFQGSGGLEAGVSLGIRTIDELNGPSISFGASADLGGQIGGAEINFGLISGRTATDWRGVEEPTMGLSGGATVEIPGVGGGFGAFAYGEISNTTVDQVFRTSDDLLDFLENEARTFAHNNGVSDENIDQLINAVTVMAENAQEIYEDAREITQRPTVMPVTGNLPAESAEPQ